MPWFLQLRLDAFRYFFGLLVFRLSGFCFISLRGLGDGILGWLCCLVFSFRGGLLWAVFVVAYLLFDGCFYGRVSLAVLSP